METGGGGWTVIQKREDGSVDFHRTWKEYKMVHNIFWSLNIILLLLSEIRYNKVILIASLESKQVLEVVFVLRC